MDLSHFILSLLHSLSSVDFVEKVDLHTEVFILKGRVILRKNRFLQIYFNELTGTTAFSLIEKDRRLWGIDFNNIRGWHLHPVGNPETHHDIEPMDIENIINALIMESIALELRRAREIVALGFRKANWGL